MTLNPEEISATHLPRGPLGGYRAGPTEELLKQVAWDYGQLAHEFARAAETVERLTVRCGELEAQVASLQTLLAGHKDSDEVAHALIASAQRAARELRESARSESEAILRKARSRAKEIEVEAQKRSGASVAAATQLKELRERVRNQLRETLDSMTANGETLPVDGSAVSEPVSTASETAGPADPPTSA